MAAGITRALERRSLGQLQARDLPQMNDYGLQAA